MSDESMVSTSTSAAAATSSSSPSTFSLYIQPSHAEEIQIYPLNQTFVRFPGGYWFKRGISLDHLEKVEQSQMLEDIYWKDKRERLMMDVCGKGLSREPHGN